MSGLLRGEEVAAHAGDVECPACERRWSLPDELGELLPPGRETPTCPDCGGGAFVPRAGREITDRYPAGTGAWEPIPHALLEHGGELGLTAVDRLVIVALELHRRRRGEWIYPGIDRLVEWTGLAERTVRRSLDRMNAAELIERRRRRRKGGRLGVYSYRLDRLWDALATSGQSDRWSPHQRSESPVASGQSDRWTSGQSDRADVDAVVDVDAVDVDPPYREASSSRSTAPPLLLPVGESRADRVRAEVLKLHAAGTLTQSQIGERVGITQGRVSQILKQEGVGRAGSVRPLAAGAGGAP